MSFWKKPGSPSHESETISPARDVAKSLDASKASEATSVARSSNPTTSLDSAPGIREGKSKEDQLLERFGKVRSALGPGTVVQGKLSFDTVVSIDGKLGGEIFSSKALFVGASGQVDAQIEVAALVVRGVVRGNIKATERIEILSGGQLLGDVLTPVLVMEEGCVFSGNCVMATNQAMSNQVSYRSKGGDKIAEAGHAAPASPQTVSSQGGSSQVGGSPQSTGSSQLSSQSGGSELPTGAELESPSLH